MKKHSLIFGSTLLLTQPVYAAGFLDDVTLVPQVGVQYKHLEFEQELKDKDTTTNQSVGGDLEADLPALVASLTTVYQKAYLSLQYAKTFDESSNETDSTVAFTNSQTEVKRKDFSATVGYNVWDSLNLFVGYMDGKTTFTPQPLCTNNCSLANIAYFANLEGRTYEQTYEEDGWFFGGSYGWQLADTGTLTVSTAYADLDSTYQDNNLGQDKFKFTGDADGFSFGINWSQPLSDDVGYYLDARTHQYEATSEQDDFDSGCTDDDGIDCNANLKSELKETITTLTVGVQWYF